MPASQILLKLHYFFFWAIRKNAHIWRKKSFFSEKNRVIYLPTPDQWLEIALVQLSFLWEPWSLLSPVDSSSVLKAPDHTTIDMDIIGLNISGRKIEPHVFFVHWLQKDSAFNLFWCTPLSPLVLNIICLMAQIPYICQGWFKNKPENLRTGGELPIKAKKCLFQCLWLVHPASTWIPPVKDTSLHC